MAYKKAQDRFASRADRVTLIQRFYGNIAVLAGQSSGQKTEINQERAATAATYLFLVEGLSTGFCEEYRIPVETALRRIANAERDNPSGGVYPAERHLLKSVIRTRFMNVTAGQHGDILRQDDRAEWAEGLDEFGILKATAYALLGETPRT